MAGWLAAFFLVSGFCGLVYETVWLRLSMGTFGVTAPSVSLVLSVFMAGLGLGSWAAGRLTRSLRGLSARSCLRLYGLCELWIAACALAVPRELAWFGTLLAGRWSAAAWGSAGYYALCGGLIAAALVPPCLGMGATFPMAMAAAERRLPERAASSFSYLYLSNVVGACAGVLVAAFALIELLGFRATSLLAAALNACGGAAALALSAAPSWGAPACAREKRAVAAPPEQGRTLALLLTTGLLSMAMEVVWIRQLTPFLGTTIYAFALILAVYLAASFCGSWLYRRALHAGRTRDALVWALSGPLALLPVAAANPYMPRLGLSRVILGVGPLSAAFGYLTPLLVDRFSGGDPDRAGRAYAVNVAGCIVGPLLAGFLLLPRLSERACLVWLAVPLFAIGWAASRARQAAGEPRLRRLLAAAAACSLLLAAFSSDFNEWLADRHPPVETARDYQADVVAAGQGFHRELIVNGAGMTTLTVITKMMAHLPLAFLPRRPKNALVICFGMGTTFRSLVSWGVDATAVELVPSVPRLFAFFHPDAAKVEAAPNARIVIDDGRRYLQHTRRTFDVITIDPAPPLVAAGSSLLYSKQFYRLVRRRLAPDGIVQQWLFRGDPAVISAFAAALRDSFPYTRAFRTPRGWHVLASRKPILEPPLRRLLSRIPPAAVKDMDEWDPTLRPEMVLQRELMQEVPIDSLIAPDGRALTDDRPINEYFFLRAYLPRAWSALGGR